MAKRRRIYYWYLEPIGGVEVNGQIAAEIAAAVGGDPSARSVLCADGEHDLWPCSEKLCRKFAKTRKLGSELNIYRKEGNGKPIGVNWLFRGHRKTVAKKSHWAQATT